MAPTQEWIHNEIDYNPKTGIMCWKKPGLARQIGRPLGTILTNGHRYARIDGIRYAITHLIWIYVFGRLPLTNLEIDHINRIKTDNRLENLREVTRALNHRNSVARTKTGIKGVYLLKEDSPVPFAADVTLYGKSIRLGRFSSLTEAINARVSYLREHGIPEEFLENEGFRK